MKITKPIMIVLLGGLLQQCSYSQSNSTIAKKEKMDSTQKKHPVYSNTDTTKVDISNGEWEKRCIPGGPSKGNRTTLDKSL